MDDIQAEMMDMLIGYLPAKKRGEEGTFFVDEKTQLFVAGIINVLRTYDTEKDAAWEIKEQQLYDIMHKMQDAQNNAGAAVTFLNAFVRDAQNPLIPDKD